MDVFREGWLSGLWMMLVVFSTERGTVDNVQEAKV